MGKAVDAAVSNMIFTIFCDPKFNYSRLGEAVDKLVTRYKKLALKGKIELATPFLIADIPAPFSW